MRLDLASASQRRALLLLQYVARRGHDTGRIHGRFALRHSVEQARALGKIELVAHDHGDKADGLLQKRSSVGDGSDHGRTWARPMAVEETIALLQGKWRARDGG